MQAKVVEVSYLRFYFFSMLLCLILCLQNVALMLVSFFLLSIAKYCKFSWVFFLSIGCRYVVWLFSLMQARSNNNLVGFMHTSSEVLLFNFQCFFCVVFLSSVAKKYKFSWFSFQIAKVTLMFCGIFTLKIMFLRVFSLGKVALTF
jgi:hypothetical protein